MSVSKPPTKPPKQLQTTLSAKIYSKSKTNLQKHRPNISPFELPSASDQLPGRSFKQLKAVLDINCQYVDLFQGLFQGVRGDGEGREDGGRLTREQRYQLECMKILKKTNANVQKLNHLRTTYQNYQQILTFLSPTPTSTPKPTPQTLIQTLLQTYKSTSTNLTTLQSHHNHLLSLQSKTCQNFAQLCEQDDNKLSQLEKQYKKMQKKLNRVMDQELYYQRKCGEEMGRMEELQRAIGRIQGSRLDIDMRIIGEQNRRDRIMRKAKEKREKSLVPTPSDENNAKPQKLTRSKSSVRYQVKNV